MTVSHALLRYYGGKARLATKLVPILEAIPHECFVTVYGGGAPELLQKRPSFHDVYNDIYDEVFNLFNVLRGPMAGELIRQIELTPYSRSEVVKARTIGGDPIERARRYLVISGQAIGICQKRRKTASFRTWHRRDRRSRTPMHEWSGYPGRMRRVVERLKSVALECLDAIKVIDIYDGPKTLFFLDPPYLREIRTDYNNYAHEMSIEDHERLLGRIQHIEGCAVITSYPNELYDRRLQDWGSFDIQSHAGVKERLPRIERVYLSPSCANCYGPLFEESVKS